MILIFGFSLSSGSIKFELYFLHSISFSLLMMKLRFLELVGYFLRDNIFCFLTLSIKQYYEN